jgi:hypothetical protein
MLKARPWARGWKRLITVAPSISMRATRSVDTSRL